MSILVAFSGGLDTSFCVPWLKEEYDLPITTVTVDTGGLSARERTAIEKRAMELGAERHILVDARQDLFETQIQYLIKGNVLRGDVYPLSVGPDRVVQARHVVRVAKELGAKYVAHGSTGAGNDQIRFDVALSVLGRGLEVITPIRDGNLSRADTTAFLKARGFDVPASTTTYSINTGMWGTTIGGRETLGTKKPLPDDAYPGTVHPADAPDEAQTIEISFEKGVPVALEGAPLDPVSLIEALNEMGAAHGVGRAIHVGDTILGIKGRVAFEAPAALVLIQAHRELEKLVLTRWQRYHKDQLADFYGMMVHEAQYFDPALRDIEALFDASQEFVTGTVSVRLFKGHSSVEGAESPYSMFDTSVATYGETNSLWDGRDARGFARILGVQSMLSPSNRIQS
jgi:argininosuccinate synthase